MAPAVLCIAAELRQNSSMSYLQAPTPSSFMTGKCLWFPNAPGGHLLCLGWCSRVLAPCTTTAFHSQARPPPPRLRGGRLTPAPASAGYLPFLSVTRRRPFQWSEKAMFSGPSCVFSGKVSFNLITALATHAHSSSVTGPDGRDPVCFKGPPPLPQRLCKQFHWPSFMGSSPCRIVLSLINGTRRSVA